MHEHAEKWAKEIGVELSYYIDSGNFGDAYQTKCGKILKVTSDPLEYICADKMLGKENDFAVNIFNTKDFDSGYFAILQEKLEINPVSQHIEMIFSELYIEKSRQRLAINRLDTAQFRPSASKEVIKMTNDITQACAEFLDSGTKVDDIHFGNIGLKANGNFGLFDQKDKSANPKQEYGEYRRIKSVTLKRETLLKTVKPKVHIEASLEP